MGELLEENKKLKAVGEGMQKELEQNQLIFDRILQRLLEFLK